MAKKKKKKKDWKNMSSTDIAQQIKDRLDGAGSGFSGGGQIIKLKKGSNKIRLLPYPCHEARVVIISTEDGWRTFPYRENGIFARLRKINEEFGQKYKPASTWMWNAIDRENPTDDDGNPVGSILMHKFQVFEGIAEKCEEYGPVMDAKKGRDLDIKRKEKGKKKKQVSYSVLKASKRKPLTEEEMEIEPVDLEELADKLWGKSEKEIMKALGLKKKDLEKLEDEEDEDEDDVDDDDDEEEDDDDDDEGSDDEEDDDEDDADEDEEDDDEDDEDIDEDEEEEEEEKPKKKKKKGKKKKKNDDVPF